jgi:CMP-N,N'-diacetyllegionaminic acid synthase
VSTALRVLAIIPARGGSKGIAGKNLTPLAGKPLLAYSIEHALAVPQVEKVVVSTDDERIASVAGSFGAFVIPRPAALAGDEATSESALLHALDHLNRQGAADPDFVLFLQATSPLRREGTIHAALNQCWQEGADSLFSASPQQGFVWRLSSKGLESVTYDFNARSRRQELDGEYIVENGSFYLFKPWVLRKHGNRLGGVATCYRMGFIESLQIDDPADVATAELLVQAIREHGWPVSDAAKLTTDEH